MKLRTEMTDFHGRMLPRSSKPQPHFDFEHDAMAAHALLQALDEKADNHEYFRIGAGCGVDLILHRAAEILAAWLGEERG